MIKMKVCIVVPCMLIDERLLRFTSRFLDSIHKRTSYKDYEVLIYDNNSEINLTERLKQQINILNNNNKFRIKILINYKFNMSQICNMSLKDSDAELFVFANNDMEIINNEWLTNIVRWFEKTPDMGICVPFHDFAGDPLSFSPIDILKDIGPISFAIFCMSRDIINKIGGFDERFDLYFQDHDLFNTVTHKGYRVLWAHNAIIKHYGERTTIDHPKIPRHDYDGAYKYLREKNY